jgi:hypothetical protein
MFWSILAGLLAATLLITGCGRSAITTQVSPPPTSFSISPLPTSSAPSETSQPTSPTVIISDVPISSLEAQNIIASAISKTAAVSNYRLTRNITQTFISGKQTDQTISRIFSQALIDVTNQKLEMTNAKAMKQPAGQASWPLAENAVYIVDGIIYNQGLFPDAPEIWSKTSITPVVWDIQNQAKYITGFLKPEDITGLSTETNKINDKVYTRVLFTVNPDLAEFWSFITNQPGIQLPQKPPKELTYDQVIKHFEFKLWIDQSSRLPFEAETDMDVFIDSNMLPSFKSTFSSSIKVNLVFGEYNQPVNIILPSDAEDAQELSQDKSK